MDQDDKNLLEKTYELSKENNHILKGIRSSNRRSSFIRILYWILIIGASIAAYYFIQPYIDTMVKAYQSVQSSLNSVKTAVNSIPKL
jgi:hypothetical protein